MTRMSELDAYLVVRKAVVQYLDWIYIGKGLFPDGLTRQLFAMLTQLSEMFASQQNEEAINSVTSKLKVHGALIQEILTRSEPEVFKMDNYNS